MNTIHIESQVGTDGVLALRVPLGSSEAKTRVMVTIEPLSRGEKAAEDWHTFIERTYGSCAGLGLDEPDDLPLQQRDWST